MKEKVHETPIRDSKFVNGFNTLLRNFYNAYAKCAMKKLIHIFQKFFLQNNSYFASMFIHFSQYLILESDIQTEVPVEIA